MSHVHSQKICRAFYVAGILTGMFFVPEIQWKLNAGIRYAF